MSEYIEREALIEKLFPIGLVNGGDYAINAKAVKVAIEKAPAINVMEEILQASNKAAASITVNSVETFAVLLKRKINPEDCGKDIMKKIDSLVDTYRGVTEQEEE